MARARFLVGDVLVKLAEIEADSVDLVLTSPPFLALRSYLPADHPDKDREIGSEPDPGTFVDTMCGIVEDLARVLAPHGSMVFELGDTFSGSGGGGGDYLENGWREGQPGFGGSAERQREGNAAHWRQKNQEGAVWPRSKSLALVPELFRITLAYGTNPLTGRVWWEGDERWLVRNVVRWVRPNPPVGALGDKFRPATSELVVFTRSSRRFFDLDAVRIPHAPHTVKYDGGTRPHYGERGGQGTVVEMEPGAKSNPNGAPPLDWWKISPKGYPGAHYATFPSELCVIPIKSMCPEKVCVTCGEPSRRIVGEAEYEALRQPFTEGTRPGRGFRDASLTRGMSGTKAPAARIVDHLGWSDCGHDNWRKGVVLDPFAGTGTTLEVATGHGRDAVGIDLDERNADLALERVGPLMLDVAWS